VLVLPQPTAGMHFDFWAARQARSARSTTTDLGPAEYLAPGIGMADSQSQMSSGVGRKVSIQRRHRLPSAKKGSSNSSDSQWALTIKWMIKLWFGNSAQNAKLWEFSDQSG
jgi:hypothetical protein